jgi:hypothetical protein
VTPRTTIGRHCITSGGSKGLTTAENSACTVACTSDEKIAHETAAAAPASVPLDDDLVAVVEAWATLPAAVRVGIMAMVRAAGGG